MYLFVGMEGSPSELKLRSSNIWSWPERDYDEMLRKFSKTKIGKLSIVDKHICDLDGKKTWFFHGDVFDLSIQNAKWIAKLGGWGYDFLILLNSLINWFLLKFILLFLYVFPVKAEYDIKDSTIILHD